MQPEVYPNIGQRDLVAFFDWIARVVVRFQEERRGELFATLIAHINEDQETLDRVHSLSRAGSSRCWFERAVLSEKLPRALGCALFGQASFARPDEVGAASQEADFVDIRLVQGVSEALQSLLSSQDSPIWIYFHDSVDSEVSVQCAVEPAQPDAASGVMTDV